MMFHQQMEVIITVVAKKVVFAEQFVADDMKYLSGKCRPA